MNSDARSGPRVTLIVARARNGVIGLGNSIPWHLSEDLRHFKATTLGHAVIMGRRTFDSIGRPLPGRRIVVLSRDPSWSHAGCEHAASLETALAATREQREVFIAGGAEVYREAMSRADRLVITEVDLAPEGDAFFEQPDPRVWTCEMQSDHVSSSGIRYSIRILTRAPRPSGGSATISATPL